MYGYPNQQMMQPMMGVELRYKTIIDSCFFFFLFLCRGIPWDDATEHDGPTNDGSGHDATRHDAARDGATGNGSKHDEPENVQPADGSAGDGRATHDANADADGTSASSH